MPPYQETGIKSGLASHVSSKVSMAVSNVGAGGVTEEEKHKAEIERLRSTHPIYNRYKQLWDFYLASYEGGRSFANQDNLFKHVREQSQDFEDRGKRVYYQNFIFPIVDFFTTFIFSETIHRDGGSNKDWYNEFVKDVNKKGDSVSSFMSNICDDMQIFGLAYVLVDSPPKPDKPVVTKADEKELKLRPYWVSVRADEVLDWVVDDFDRYTYIKRIQKTTTVERSTMKMIVVEKYTEWTPDEIKISTIDVTDASKPVFQGAALSVNEVGSVPFEVVRFKRSKIEDYMGESFLRDLSFIAREIMNLTSLLQEFLYRQCFNVLAMEKDDNIEESEQLDGDIGTANLLKYPKGSHVPAYVSPPVQPAEFLARERESRIESMFRIASQDAQSDMFNGGKSSGFSKSQSFQKTVPKIATRADMLEGLENRLMKLTMKYAGRDTWDGSIKYKDHYEVTNLADALSQMATMFKDLQIQSKTFASTQLKRMVSEFDGKLSPDDLKKVEKEIDDINWDEWFDTQKLAFIGRSTSSPEAAATFGLDPITGEPTTGPVKGKDTPTAPSTPQRPSATSATIHAASTKEAKK
jgi:hypothetical protein